MVEFTRADKILLLGLARKSIGCKLREEHCEEPATINPALQTPAGVFVTLHKQGKLRGCIGTFYADLPLYKQVMKMARASAFEDMRFSTLRLNEFSNIDIEISVLSLLKELKNTDDIVIGQHGIYITSGFHRGVLLPQVAAEYGWDRITFLEHTCMKAGLPKDAWRKDATIEIFDATIFGEKELEKEEE